MPARTAFFVSDRTGITAETFGNSLLTQFDTTPFNRVTLPFVDTAEKALEAARRISEQGRADGFRPLVFSTLVDEDLRAALFAAEALCLDFFQAFIGPLEMELAVKSSHTVGRTHGMVNYNEYKTRIDAVNYSMTNDDGVQTREFDDADVVLVGVSRSGKTPTCLYMALQYGIRAANYPLIPEDLQQMKLPERLMKHRNKIYGLTIAPERLAQIREERRPASKYASLDNCRWEVREAEAILRSNSIPCLDTTTKSIEELATTILHSARLSRRVF